MAQDTPLTPMMMQYHKVKSQYKNEVLFFRLGDFYEMFDQDAVEVSRLLNLTLTHRANQPMCGIPYHAAKVYIARLLRLGKKIAICEQVGEIPKGGKGIAERKVVEIITPGTAVESEYLDGSKSNYLAALSIFKGRVGFAYVDISTGSFKATSWPASLMQQNFAKEIKRAAPSEFLLPQSLKTNQDIQSLLNANSHISVSYYPDWDFSIDLSEKKLLSQFGILSLKSFGIKENSAEIIPAGFLIDYLEKTTNASLLHIKSIQLYSDSDFLIMDDSSRTNLELTENMRDGSSSFTLLECVNHTKTSMGSRLLRNWINFPLTKYEEIIGRQNKITYFFNNRDLLEKIRNVFSSILDIERLSSRIAMDKAHGKDLQALRFSLESWLKVYSFIDNSNFKLKPTEDCSVIIDLIKNSILEDPSTSLTEGGIIKSGWSEELDHYRMVYNNFNQILSDYEAQERRESGINNLKIKYTNAFGYCIEVTKGKLSSVPPHFILRRSMMNADRFSTPKLQELELELNEASSKILQLEHNLFIEIRDSLKKNVDYLLSIAFDVAQTDVIASLAYAAIQNNWICPEICQSTYFEIKNGRHPVVEAHLPIGEFVPNDSLISAEEEDNIPSFNLITGPNMAGKSTYLRQNAIICLLAQVGSYVPATFAKLGIVDKIFCRVGASDNLAKGESTFLVEMMETANILRSATNKSLVIMDEVGRGTSTEDGLAIAQAVSEFLINDIKCKSFFATHYHELTRMEHKSIKKLCLEIYDENGSLVFLRKVKEGITENSYGIHVAKLAGVPQSVIDRANYILSIIQNEKEENDFVNIDCQQESLNNENLSNDKSLQVRAPGLFSDEEIILSEILSIDCDNITPMKALKLIDKWKSALSGQ